MMRELRVRINCPKTTKPSQIEQYVRDALRYFGTQRLSDNHPMGIAEEGGVRGPLGIAVKLIR